MEGLCVRFCSFFCLEICSSNQPRTSRQMNPQWTWRSPCGVLPHRPNIQVYRVHAKRKLYSPLLFSTGQDRNGWKCPRGHQGDSLIPWWQNPSRWNKRTLVSSRSVCGTGEISPYLKEWLSGYRDGSVAKSPWLLLHRTPALIHSTHLEAHNHLQSSSRVPGAISDLLRTQHDCGTDITCKQNIQT